MKSVQRSTGKLRELKRILLLLFLVEIHCCLIETLCSADESRNNTNNSSIGFQSRPSWINYKASGRSEGEGEGAAVPLQISDRIVGGTEIEAHEFPFLVSLRKNGRHFCGGSIISSKWILTAAHCTVFKPSECQIVAGSHDRMTLEGTEQFRNIQKMIVHPQYNEKTHENDIALWSTNDSFTMNDFVQPVQIPVLGVDMKSLETDNCTESRSSTLTTVNDTTAAAGTVIGWGRQEEGGSLLPRVPQKVTVPMEDNKVCSGVYKNFNIPIESSMICAGGQVEKDACQGDSGGPMVCSSMCNGRVVLRQCGIVSFGAGCGRLGVPGIYTSVQSFSKFISHTVSTA